ncbi:copper amine oxidase N-terminal domain-containing protein [Lysinibacillus sp. JNUCC 51]|uniref:copper amine oxidase N-terminal domain-containing protein n=1 Tax=Lysinibacillus sp. JNUCC-51 TaxID=2792479 RepID=UPI001936FB3B|nr:copper amine oxidase N-terminal domain-containing protein [Lysinibacillus sp. JNUCC-51]
MLKRLFFVSFLFYLCSLIYIGGGSYAYAKNEVVFLDGGTAIDGRTMLPMRGIFESLGATVAWDASSQTVTASRGKTTIKLKVGSNKAIVNGKESFLDSPARIINSTTLVPVRFVGESLNLPVEWNSKLRVVNINTAGKNIFIYVNDPTINTDKNSNVNKYNQLVALHNNILVVYQNLERQESLYPTYSQEYRNVLEKESKLLELQIKVNQRMEAILNAIIRQG